MAKHEDATLLTSFDEFKKEKDIDRSTLISILEDAFRKEIAKIYGSDENFSIIFNPEKNDCEIMRTRIVVEDGMVEDPNKQISLSEANQIDEYEVDDEVYETIDVTTFGRRVVLNLRQTIASKSLDIKKQALYEKYKSIIGTIVTGEVYQTWKREVLLLDDEGNEMFLPKEEQIPTDVYRKGDRIRALVLNVDNNNNNPKIFLSRTSPDFLRCLFEQEVPEIHDGLITIKNVVRVPGEKAKVAVESFDDRIDPVGACVGIKGARIHGIVRELRNENIDVIQYSNNTSLYISRAMTPAKVVSIQFNEDSNVVNVYIKPDEISQAIGKGGYNIRLAGQLTGYQLEVRRDDVDSDEEDVLLADFKDEIDEWVIDVLYSIGCETAKSVLKLSREELIQRTDLEDETIDDVLRILRSEFESDEN
ncbi:MAG: transcription termination factor NusA [Paludibacteraceae bacterium]|nr:transcription termination/antitermination protein NusA [Candidatus Colousia faecequi]MCQ2338922.1 transcription termination factor NusA [Paludibacteraceae bacterium]